MSQTTLRPVPLSSAGRSESAARPAGIPRVSRLTAALPRPAHPDARVLIVDDLDLEVRLIATILGSAGYRHVRGEIDPRRALDAFEEMRPDLVVLDLHMPGMSGIDVLHAIRAAIPSEEYLPVLMITADTGPDVKRDALAAGARDFLAKPFDATEVLLRIGNLIEARTLHEHLAQRVREKTRELEETRDIALLTVAKLVDSRDPETARHLERMAESSRLLAEALRAEGRHPEIDDAFIEQIYRSSPLHDIGKVGIPDAILHKPGPLTADERKTMQRHTLIGGGTLRGVIATYPGHTFLSMAAEIAYQHHERWDGSGYPHGLTGEQIGLPARIVALADAYDAITSVRTYETARSHDEALARITRDRGTHFDPQVVDAFLRVGPRLRALHAAS